MTKEQFEIIEKYLEDFKDQLNQFDTKSIKADTDAIWDKLKEQNELLQKILSAIGDIGR